jgi:hypothetical protein
MDAAEMDQEPAHCNGRFHSQIFSADASTEPAPEDAKKPSEDDDKEEDKDKDKENERAHDKDKKEGKSGTLHPAGSGFAKFLQMTATVLDAFESQPPKVLLNAEPYLTYPKYLPKYKLLHLQARVGIKG